MRAFTFLTSLIFLAGVVRRFNAFVPTFSTPSVKGLCSTTCVRRPGVSDICRKHEASILMMSAQGGGDDSADEGVVSAATTAQSEGEAKLPFFLDPNTRGGAVIVPVLSLILPVGLYGVFTATGMDSDRVGANVAVAYTLIGLLGWVGSYFFRVATKNMTYAEQLRNYEQAVIEKRFEELEEEEVDALLEEVNEP